MEQRGTSGVLKKVEKGQQEEYADDIAGLVCNMMGAQWEKLLFPIIIDSGACVSVMPIEWRSHIPKESTPQSEVGEFFRAAIGRTIPNEGQRMVSMMTREGAFNEMRFSFCPVTKTFGSVSQTCRAGRRIIFNPFWDQEGLYIEYIDVGERLWFIEENGLYVLDTRAAFQHKQASTMRSNGCQRFVNPSF